MPNPENSNAQPQGDAAIMDQKVKFGDGEVTIKELLATATDATGKHKEASTESETLRNRLTVAESALDTLADLKANHPRKWALIDQVIKASDEEIPDDDDEDDETDPKVKELRKQVRDLSGKVESREQKETVVRLKAQIDSERDYIWEQEKDGILAGKTPAQVTAWYGALFAKAKKNGVPLRFQYLLDYDKERIERAVKKASATKEAIDKDATSGMSAAHGGAGVGKTVQTFIPPKNAKEAFAIAVAHMEKGMKRIGLQQKA